MNVRIISKSVGKAVMMNSVVMGFCALYAAFNHFDTSFSPLLLGTIISSLAGFFPLIFVKEKSPISLDEGFLIILLSWFLCCLFGMIPYVLWGGEFNIMDAWFESVSGYTTTGATSLSDVEALPRGLLLWRSCTHFLGGIGIVVFMLMILPSIEQHRSRISGLEISDLTRGDYRKRTDSIVKIRIYVYLGLILAEWILLMIAGMPSFDAINISFSTIATGGFAITNNSLIAYHSVAIEVIVCIFMFLASLHLGLIFNSVVNRSNRLIKAFPTRVFFYSILAAGLLIAVDLLASGQETNLWNAMRVSFFECISSASTTGFGITDASVWPMFSIALMILLTIQGGCTGSTAGGIKSDRMVIFFASLRTQMIRYIHPSAVVPVKVGKTTVKDDIVSMVNSFIVLYLAIFMICALFYLACGMPAIDAFSTSASSIGNLGAAFGAEGPMGNYSLVPAPAKFVMSLEMLIGRLEIFPFVSLLFINKRR